MPPSPAPWKPTFLSHISKLTPPIFVLSTLAPIPIPSSAPQSPSPLAFAPRARTVVFRGFWAELPPATANPLDAATAPRNPPAYESELFTLTTDVRMRKVRELFASAGAGVVWGGGGGGGEEDSWKGSGGGGSVEAVWWVEAVGTQWRVKGRGFVVCAGDIDREDGAGSGDGEEGGKGEGGHVKGKREEKEDQYQQLQQLEEDEESGVAAVRREVGGRMRVVDKARHGRWSWSREVLSHFANHSPAMRGSFRGPPPGQPTSMPFNSSELVLGKKIESADDPVALQNFRVVIIVPDSVEQTDLSDPNKARRWLYTFERGEWKTEELWP